jgi:outer membrane protein assembly factor BamB
MYLLRWALLLSVVSAQSTNSPLTYPPNNQEWSGWGANIYNNRWASANTAINSTNINALQQHCHLSFYWGVSATPVIASTIAYFPTWNGLFLAVDYTSCAIIWQINVHNIILSFGPINTLITQVSSPASRSSPQIDGSVLFFTTLASALLIAVDITTGNTLATTQVNTHPLAVVTMSPTFYNGTIYVGSSSQEEVIVGVDASYQCCDFIGNVAAFTFNNATNQFTSLWNLPLLPANAGWSGVGVWGSQPAIDPSRNQVYFATGNLYTLPASFDSCKSVTCMPANVYQESVLALDLYTGKINWFRQITPFDAWTAACGKSPEPAFCPPTPGPDSDFGMAPTFVPASLGNGVFASDSVVVGQKNGIMYSLDAQTGATNWNRLTGPAADLGGLSWGMASDDFSVFFTAINWGGASWTLPSGQVLSNAAFGAVSQSTGAITWEVSAPQGYLSMTPPTVVGDIVLTGTLGAGTAAGGLVALNKATGALLLNQDLDCTYRGGIAVQDNYLMLGTGYPGNPSGNGSFYVFMVRFSSWLRSIRHKTDLV